jgi:hypothetical protein
LGAGQKSKNYRFSVAAQTFFAAAPLLAIGGTGLLGLGGVDAMKSDFSAANPNGIAVDNAGNSGNAVASEGAHRQKERNELKNRYTNQIG